MDNSYDYGQHDPSITSPVSNSGSGSPSYQTYDSHGNPIGIQTGPNNNPSSGWGSQGTSQGGGGGGGGGLPLGGSGSAPATGYTSLPQGGGLITGTGAATATGSGVLSTASQVLPWLQFAASIYESQRSGRFVQPPMSPEQKTMFDWAMHYIQTTPDNRATINSILGYDLGHPASIDMEALRAGKVGYTPAGHMPGTDLAAMIRNNAGAVGGTTTAMPPPTTGNFGGGQLADTLRNIQSP